MFRRNVRNVGLKPQFVDVENLHLGLEPEAIQICAHLCLFVNFFRKENVKRIHVIMDEMV